MVTHKAKLISYSNYIYKNGLIALLFLFICLFFKNLYILLLLLFFLVFCFLFVWFFFSVCFFLFVCLFVCLFFYHYLSICFYPTFNRIVLFQSNSSLHLKNMYIIKIIQHDVSVPSATE